MHSAVAVWSVYSNPYGAFFMFHFSRKKNLGKFSNGLAVRFYDLSQTTPKLHYYLQQFPVLLIDGDISSEKQYLSVD